MKVRTVKVEVIHPSYIRLRLPTDETHALVLTTITRLRFISAFDVRTQVIKALGH
jgi:hypothetical protein